MHAVTELRIGEPDRHDVGDTGCSPTAVSTSAGYTFAPPLRIRSTRRKWADRQPCRDLALIVVQSQVNLCQVGVGDVGELLTEVPSAAMRICASGMRRAPSSPPDVWRSSEVQLSDQRSPTRPTEHDVRGAAVTGARPLQTRPTDGKVFRGVPGGELSHDCVRAALSRSQASQPPSTAAPHRPPARLRPAGAAVASRPGATANAGGLQSLANAPGLGTEKPPASCAGVNPRGNSSKASELPRGSATILVVHLFVEEPRHHRIKQRPRIVVGQTPDHQLRQSTQTPLLAGLVYHEHHADRIGQQTSGDERDRLLRSFVEPLGVIDDAEQRPLVRFRGQEAQKGQTDEETVRRRSGASAERDAKGVALRLREL